MGSNRNLIDLTGRTFGALTVVRRAGSQRRSTDGHLRPTWECLCDCGETAVVLGFKLRGGLRKACGINGHNYRSPLTALTAGERSIYHNMLHRCYAPECRAFKYYGAKGVKVCARWRKDFASFLSDVGPRPSLEHTLDRIDPHGNYEPENCRWALPKVQARNKRDTVKVLFEGKTITIADYAEHVGLSSQMLRRRLARGWSIEAALTKAPKGQPFQQEMQLLDALHDYADIPGRQRHVPR